MRKTIAYNILGGFGILALLCAITSMTEKPAPPDCQHVLNQMFDAIKQVKTLRFNLYANERIDNSYSSASSVVKVNTSPLKIYYKDLKKGIEILWPEDESEDALVNPNGFPYINLRLDPAGKLMHKDQHQTIDRLGYAYLGNTISHSLERYPDTYQKYVHYKCDTTCNGYPCYKIEIDFPEFGYYSFMVKDKGETVKTIAAKYYLNDYLILNANHLSSYEDELKVGQILSIPNVYGKCTLVTIRKEDNLPLEVTIYDNLGLLEEYSFTNVQVNSTISDVEFTSKYSDYHF
jgi:hypothetical protein